VRQRGTPIRPGRNVGRGCDDTLFAKIPGTVEFERKKDGKRWVHIIPAQAAS